MTFTPLDIVRQLNAASLGSVKVRELNQLVFEDIDVHGSRALNQSRVKNIIHRFNHEGCRRLDPLTWIPCEISKSVLQSLLPVDSRNLRLEFPIDLRLPEGSELHCLQGQHRIAAAVGWLEPNDLWWNLILYDSEKLNDNCRNRLREAENGSQIFSDGEIFRNIRHYQLRGEEIPAQEWLAKWSPTKCRDFNRIYEPRKIKDKRKDLANRLDALLVFPALWIHWFMGIHLTDLNCPEVELCAYLHKIYSAWFSLTCGNSQVLDPDTLELLHGRYPRLSLDDQRFIQQIFDDNIAFPRVTDPISRSQLLQAALNYSGIIPSLHLFLEDIKYLKPMTDIIKKVLPFKFKGTIRQAMLRYFIPTPKNRIQVSENDFEEREYNSQEELFWSAYRQCFLFAMRHFFGLTDTHPRGHRQFSKSQQRLEPSDLWKRFKVLLCHLGFVLDRSQNVKASSSTPPSTECKAIEILLTRLRPPELFEYDHAILNECSNHVATILSQIKPRILRVHQPLQSVDVSQNWSLANRCGMTSTDTFFSDRKYLFLWNIYSPDDKTCESVTSFAVKRDIFKSFFPDRDLDTTGTFPTLFPSGNDVSNMQITPTDLDREHDTTMLDTISQPVNSGGKNDRDDMAVRGLDLDATIQRPDKSVVLSSSRLTVSNQLALIGETASDLDVTTALSIISQSRAACTCTTTMTPDAFWASCKSSLLNLPYLIIFGVSRHEVLFMRLSNANLLFEYVPDILEGWCAKVEELPGHFPTLRIITKAEIQAQAIKGSILFYGDAGDFRSTLKSYAPAASITLPLFDTRDGSWKTQRMIEG
ncbi:hypothetical protein F1880_005513 [Penicillium rolfsii]|nr:hypothetical protein F1880_005513 [Penicillium rolfsii]